MKTRRLQILCIAAGLLCILAGITRGELDVLFVKAVNVCLECIGIG